MWHDTAFTRLVGIRYPIVQGPFGGGYSSPRLTATVSNAGGLGSYGALGHRPEDIRALVSEIRGLTAAPFAVNLWVSTEDAGASRATRAEYEAALRPLLPFFEELGVEPPAFPFGPKPGFDEQAAALIDARPPVFSFIFGIPQASVLEACRARSIVTMSVATTVEEATALDAAGVDVVVASGFEAGGHRASFLRPAESSLTGLFSLVPQVVDAVRAPVVAAGGIADGRGVAAALTLGASGAQIGSAFLACEESNAPPDHKAALLHARSRPTFLTRVYTGRLARGFSNVLGETLHAAGGPWLPYPLQGDLLSALRVEAIRRGRPDLMALWAGQSAPLLKHRRAGELFAHLVAQVDRLMARGSAGQKG
jgi:nitronate monooxygenase